MKKCSRSRKTPDWLTLESTIEASIPTEDSVDVIRAEREFAALSRQLSKASSAGLHPDKEAQNGDDEFDLLNYLRGTAPSA
ncbi:hypothetical protein Pst134EA_031529 [Puccinia striiformis f. sp. tritici]|uniref:uncharacterized protein n=1 Tax=Puccinia striiformis f. sp. tritici TaxID=168172 RepID=UPI002008A7ED|nr:uncharacterized protein Pst134EA_031529 [Puccinia striiformis f. sp. tritici]KAH9442777.1 hypothetical protein Pst134EA_031529 [Puccinia striiformis f. sp. tritici]